ncbi:ribbon-helix-helix domain-containing protein [Haematospirillum jordaniae]|uniref:ribbon-helix-helix domain-containing protein n=1 Tax=Haematospirillum jordaniae TaxID=1549855 RepID=UPI00143304F0|nr:ribbon-helix-helix domain-containing protein [Haematospirillum jordaniae]NKD85304.1 ribbon-helix-helix domain-containing protein [Haematospirillum jordaniae]
MTVPQSIPANAPAVVLPGRNGGGSTVIKRSVRIAGHPTSVSLEDVFWDALRSIAATRGLSINAMVSEIDSARSHTAGGNLSSAVRVYILEWFRCRAVVPPPSPDAPAS